MQNKWLAIVDVDRIHSYICETDRLREIAGASSLLDEINRTKTKELYEKISTEADKLLVNGGGITKAVFADKDRAEEFGSKAARLYPEHTHSATATWCVEKFENGSFKEANERSELLLKELKATKGRNGQSFTEINLITSPFLRRCSVCGVRPASKRIKEDLYCVSCLEKVNAREKDIAFVEQKGVHRLIQETLGHPKANDGNLIEVEDVIPYDFDSLVFKGQSQAGNFQDSAGTEKSFIGLIMADGNSIGEHIKAKVDSEDKIQQFSTALEVLIRKAVADAVKTSYNDYSWVAWQGMKTLPLRVLMLGGDDIMVVTAGQLALPLAVEICNNFEEGSQKDEFMTPLCLNEGEKLTLSAGVAIGKVKHPFFDFMHLAEGLLASAKQKGLKLRDNGSPPSCIDFSAIRWSGRISLAAFREKLLEFEINSETFRLTAKPYTIDEFRSFVLGLEILRRKVPRSKLKALSGIPGKIMSREQMEDRAAEWCKRAGLSSFSEIKDLFPAGTFWGSERYSHKFITKVMDAVELLDFWPRI